MKIVTLPVGALRANCYVLYDESRRDALVVDPGGDADAILRALAGRKPTVLLTHGHFDHTGALPAFADARIWMHALDAPMLSDASLSVGAEFGDTAPRPPATDYVQEGDELSLCGLRVHVLHTPGHTPGGVCYDIEGALLTGDTLFAHGYGRVDYPGGDQRALIRSLRRLLALHGRTYYPGHEEAGLIR